VTRLFRDGQQVEARLRHIHDPHVSPLNDWVRSLQARLGSDAVIPWFDPADGGVNAQILWLLEAPGGKATRERGGSGFISCDNNDGTAENTYRTREEAGVSRSMVVHWNVIPYYIGTDTKIRAWRPDDVAAVGPLLRELVAMLPKLRCVILGGGAAQKVWKEFGPTKPNLRVIDCPHPSPPNVNTRPGTREAIVATWKQAGSLINGDS